MHGIAPFHRGKAPFDCKEGQTAYRIGSTRQNYTGCRFIWQDICILLKAKRLPMRVRPSPFDIGRNHGPYNLSRTEQAAVARLLGDAGYAALPSKEKAPPYSGAFPHYAIPHEKATFYTMQNCKIFSEND